MIRAKVILLATALLLTAMFMAQASGSTEAYFSDTKAGAITGTIGVGMPLYRFDAGTSKARHWDLKDVQTSGVLPIAQLDGVDELYLDFGDEVVHNNILAPDVFRIVSQDTVPRSVSFVFRGPAAIMFGEASLDEKNGVLQPGATQSVRVRVDIPSGVVPDEYHGELVVLIEGAAERVIPVVIAVRPGKQIAPSEGSVRGQPSPQPTLTIEPTSPPEERQDMWKVMVESAAP